MGFDGIPVGVIRSDQSTMKVTPEEWCKIFGHKWRKFSDGTYCETCWVGHPDNQPDIDPGSESGRGTQDTVLERG